LVSLGGDHDRHGSARGGVGDVDRHGPGELGVVVVELDGVVASGNRDVF
jgi:hypothetical protein